MTASTLVDPPIEHFNSAFLCDKKIILDYTVGVENGVGRSYGQPGDNWCEFNIDKSYRRNSTVLKYKIHRKKFESDNRKLHKLPIVDFNNSIYSSERNPESIRKYLIDHYKGEPIVATYTNKDHLDNLYVAYIPSDSNDLHILTEGILLGFAKYHYVPLSKYPIIAVLYPFAALIDVVIYPVTIFLPRVVDR